MSDRLVAAFNRDGAVVVRDAVDRGWIERLAAAVEDNLADLGPWSCQYTPTDGPGGFVDDYCNWERFAAYEQFVRESEAAGLVGRLMGSRTVRFFHEHVLVKEPGTRESTPWHHDLPYYPVDGDQVCSLWLPLDPVPLDACPRFVAGSHRWPGLLAPRTFVDQNPYPGAEGLAAVPDIDADPKAFELLAWDLEPGDAIAFHMRTVHDAPGTEHLTTRRRAFSTRWLGDDAVWAERPYPTSPPFPDVDLRAGQPLDHPRFPLVVG
jgi:ectoine hydroxylase-related dioxygenase (phytanoyl-CoA dioxygenase family)